MKTNEALDDRTPLAALLPVLELDDTELLAALEEHLDLERFLTYWAMELLVAHVDGYARNTNNFYLYEDRATGRLDFIPWGIDAILVDLPTELPWEQAPPPDAVWSEAILTRRLYNHPETRARYQQRLVELLDTVPVMPSRSPPPSTIRIVLVAVVPS